MLSLALNLVTLLILLVRRFIKGDQLTVTPLIGYAVISYQTQTLRLLGPTWLSCCCAARSDE